MNFLLFGEIKEQAYMKMPWLFWYARGFLKFLSVECMSLSLNHSRVHLQSYVMNDSVDFSMQNLPICILSFSDNSHVLTHEVLSTLNTRSE